MKKFNTLVVSLIIMITGNIAIADTCSWLRFKEQHPCATNSNNLNEMQISFNQRTSGEDTLKRILLITKTQIISHKKQRISNEMQNQIRMNSWTLQRDRARLKANCDSKSIFSKVTNKDEFLAFKYSESLECWLNYRAETRQMADWY